MNSIRAARRAAPVLVLTLVLAGCGLSGASGSRGAVELDALASIRSSHQTMLIALAGHGTSTGEELTSWFESESSRVVAVFEEEAPEVFGARAVLTDIDASDRAFSVTAQLRGSGQASSGPRTESLIGYTCVRYSIPVPTTDTADVAFVEEDCPQSLLSVRNEGSAAFGLDEVLSTRTEHGG